MNEIYTELAAHALQNIRASLSDLRVVIAHVDTVAETFPLWDDLREVTNLAGEVANQAADKCDALQEERD
jgi:hypothetical protein